MAEDEVRDDPEPSSPDDEAAAGDPVRAGLAGLAGRPGRAAAVAVAAVLVLLYAVFVQQELFLVIWLGVSGFLLYLLWRFVRAHERLAAAAERVADRD